jgi:hypothetical protein
VQRGGLGFSIQQDLVTTDHVGIKLGKTLRANLSRIIDMGVSSSMMQYKAVSDVNKPPTSTPACRFLSGGDGE